MKKALISGLALSSIVFGANATLGTTLTIDDFTRPFAVDPFEILDDGGPTTASSNETGLPTSSVIGGTRNTTIEILDPLAAFFDTTTLSIGTGVLDQSVNGATGNLTTTTVLWNRGGLGLNANLSTFDRFRLNVSNFNLAIPSVPSDIGTITLRARNSSGDPFSQSSQTLDVISSATEIDFLFTSFAGLSLNSIFDIELEVTGNNPGLLFTFESLEAFGPDVPPPSVPEPSLVFGCLFLGGTRFAITGWKRYKNAGKN